MIKYILLGLALFFVCDIFALYLIEFHIDWIAWLIKNNLILIFDRYSLLLIFCDQKWSNSQNNLDFVFILLFYITASSWGKLSTVLLAIRLLSFHCISVFKANIQK